MNIYRSRRLRRALGALPSTQILPPGRSIPAPPTASPHRRGGQYRGDFGMIAWNAQALFAGDGVRRQAKMRYLHSLVARADVILITEAHGTGGDHAAWRPPQGCRAWWTAGATTGHAGVGVVIKEVFLQRFDRETI